MNYIKNHKSTILFFLISLILVANTAFSVRAQESNEISELSEEEQVNEIIYPTFPQCSSPQGDSVVYYSEGVHGIPGETVTYYGSDEVFRLTDETLTQCFCAVNGDGIQTNWWKVSSLTLEEIASSIDLGWIYIPNGALWGLDEEPYIALNIEFECGDSSEDGDTQGSTSKKSSKKSSKSKSSSDSRVGGILAGSVLGASDTRFGGEVLGLATTGNRQKIVFLYLLFLSSLVISIALLVKSKRIQT